MMLSCALLIRAPLWTYSNQSAGSVHSILARPTWVDSRRDLTSEQTARPKQKQTRLTSEQIDWLVGRYASGVPANRLAEEFGVHRTTVLKHLKARGVGRSR